MPCARPFLKQQVDVSYSQRNLGPRCNALTFSPWSYCFTLCSAAHLVILFFETKWEAVDRSWEAAKVIALNSRALDRILERSF